MIHPEAVPYREIVTDNESKFQAFRGWCRRVPIRTCEERFAIQLVCHPNHDARSKRVDWFVGDIDGFQRVGGAPDGFLRANCFKNLRTDEGVGHRDGLFYELNLYLRRELHSPHHNSLVRGHVFERDCSHDGETVRTRGGSHFTR